MLDHLVGHSIFAFSPIYRPIWRGLPHHPRPLEAVSADGHATSCLSRFAEAVGFDGVQAKPHLPGVARSKEKIQALPEQLLRDFRFLADGFRRLALDPVRRLSQGAPPCVLQCRRRQAAQQGECLINVDLDLERFDHVVGLRISTVNPVPSGSMATTS